MEPKRRKVVFHDPGTSEPAPAGFLERCAEFGVAFDEGDVGTLGRFLALLASANKVVNLTAVREPGEAWERHIFDALTLLPLLDGARTVADVGSGGGVPGLPLAIVLPEVRFTLVEATAKKAQFLLFAAEKLGLGNVRVEPRRAEELGQDAAHRGAYDAVVARAVGRLAVVSELCVPLAREEGGRVLLVKGSKADEELAEGRQALHKLHAVHAGTVETPTGRVVVLEKSRPTPRIYPRRPGEPKRTPLG